MIHLVYSFIFIIPACLMIFSKTSFVGEVAGLFFHPVSASKQYRFTQVLPLLFLCQSLLLLNYAIRSSSASRNGYVLVAREFAAVAPWPREGPWQSAIRVNRQPRRSCRIV